MAERVDGRVVSPELDDLGAAVVGSYLGGRGGAASAGHMSDPGVDDKFMKRLGEQLTPGAAALIMLVREANTERILSEVKIPGEIIQTSLSADAEEALRNALAAAGRT